MFKSQFTQKLTLMVVHCRVIDLVAPQFLHMKRTQSCSYSNCRSDWDISDNDTDIFAATDCHHSTDEMWKM